MNFPKRTFDGAVKYLSTDLKIFCRRFALVRDFLVFDYLPFIRISECVADAIGAPCLAVCNDRECATPNSNHIPDGTNLSIALPFYREPSPIFAIKL
jgi:hypothetical protein